MKSAIYTRRIKNSREIVGVATVTFGSKNEPTPLKAEKYVLIMHGDAAEVAKARTILDSAGSATKGRQLQAGSPSIRSPVQVPITV